METKLNEMMTMVTMRIERWEERVCQGGRFAGSEGLAAAFAS